MASSMPDSSPAGKSGYKNRDKMKLKNDDGREGPMKGANAAFNDKSVDSMPNEGAPKLPGKGVIAKLI